MQTSLRQVHSVNRRSRLGRSHQLLHIRLSGGDHAAHHAFIAQVPNQRAGVDIRQHRNLVSLQVFVRHLVRAVVRRIRRKLAHDQPFDVRLTRFFIVGIGAVIADFWIGENDDLSSIGGIGKDLLVAGNGCIKNYFARAFDPRSVAFAAEDSAVFQRKDSLHRILKQWIF